MNETLYLTWAPPESPWSAWVKPVLFAHAALLEADHDTSRQSTAPVFDGGTALVIDLPGRESIACGLACAQAGWRPVPLYNSLPESYAIIDMQPVLAGLRWAAETLMALALPASAPPAFLLDARRSEGPAFPPSGSFDNRAVCYPSDFPSAEMLRTHGIARIILLQSKGLRPQPDLHTVLQSWAANGLLVEVRSEETMAISPCDLRPEPFLRRWLRRLRILLSYYPQPGGVFGERVPRAHG